MKQHSLKALVTSALLAFLSISQPAAAASHAKAYFVNLKDGATVSSPLKIKFGVSGMKVAPAGKNVPNSGHFHLLIDTIMSAEDAKYAIPKDDQHLHFGKGQTQTTLELKPGKHTLQLVMGDSDHMLHNPPVASEIITVTVK